MQLEHRVVMAPLTGSRSVQPGSIPGDLMLDYYTQRASEGGLIVSEATPISIAGGGWFGAPGLYSDEQVAGWRRITNAVHEKRGYMFSQLWHTGRASHVHTTNITPVSSSVNPEYCKAAGRAKAAGFDGVELHAGNGYLPDQFLQDGINKRTDMYGGSIENRSRFLLQVVEAMVSVWGGNRVAVRIAPSGTWNGVSDSNPIALFDYVAKQLDRFGLAYLHVIEPRIKGNVLIAEGQGHIATTRLRKVFTGTVIAAGGFEPDTAEAAVREGDADLVAFGRHFVANPDLPKRIRLGLPLNAYDRDTFYTFDARGYTDYPFYEQRSESLASTL
jgi:N-ethylmaleimide reductase